MSKKSPQLRFKGFTDAWEERKVGNFLSESKIKGSDGSVSKKLTVKLWRKGIVPKEEIYKGSSATQYYIRLAGQFMYGKLDFLNQAFGILPNELDGYESTLDSPAFDFKDGINPNFFLEYVCQENFYKYQGNIANGSRKAKRIHADTFFDMPITIPSFEEQEKIGNFFKELDDAIALHQRKLDLLKEQKKGYLQKMFPKNGAKVPELRFAGFADDWEERKLGEVTKSFDGKRVPIDSGLRISGEYPYYGASGIIDYVDDYIFDGEYVLLAEDGANITMRNYPVAYLTQGKFWLNNHAHIMRMIDGSNYFLVQVLEKIDYIKYNTGTAQPKLNSKVVKNIEFKLPHVNEQRKIGTFFKQIDKTIALHQRKLDFLKEQKKGFLQKMFV